MIAALGLIFLTKLVFQWIELNLKTKSAEEFYTSIFRKKAILSEQEIEHSRAPIANLSNRMHILTHNIYYPAGLIISELLIMLFLVPFVVYISPRASFLVFGVTLILSIPALRVARKKITKLNEARTKIDFETDYEVYLDYRTYYDQGRIRSKTSKLNEKIQIASEIDRKIVKLGSYSRLTIELSFIVSVILTFSFINRLVAADSRIQFFAVLAYSFFRVIPAFTRIVSARNQIASHQTEFLELAKVEIPTNSQVQSQDLLTFSQSITFVPITGNASGAAKEMRFLIGDVVLVKGETGVGKTTLLKSIGGLRLNEYSVTIDGNAQLNSKSWKPSVALVSQNPFLDGKNLMEIITGDDSISEIDEAVYGESLRISCLDSWGKNRINDLTNENVSGGERKQIALARAIYSKPEILLLDELTAGLDQTLANNILLNIFNCKRFKLVVLASHDSLPEQNFSHVINLK